MGTASKSICCTLLVGGLAMLGSTVNAGVQDLIPDEIWKEDLKVWLARAMVSEAGWDNTSDHVAIAYVLLRRWQIARRAHPKISMISVIRKYCAGFGARRPTPRQLWVRHLNSDGSRPRHWPNDIFWSDYRSRWLAVLDVAEQWKNGEQEDPCKGLARYWGGPLDRPSQRMVKMDCGETVNSFYTVRTLLPGYTPPTKQNGRD